MKDLRGSTSLANTPAVEMERRSRDLAEAYGLAIQHPFTAIPYVGDGQPHRLTGMAPELMIFKRVPAPEASWHFKEPRKFFEVKL